MVTVFINNQLSKWFVATTLSLSVDKTWYGVFVTDLQNMELTN